jgi:hypothetical protein
MKKTGKRKKSGKRGFLIAISLFAIGFMYLCQHMNVIKLGYALGKEKTVHKQLSNLNKSLCLEKASFKSPHYLNKVACSNLGLNVSRESVVRKINIVRRVGDSEKANKIARGLRKFFKFESKAIAKPANKN